MRSAIVKAVVAAVGLGLSMAPETQAGLIFNFSPSSNTSQRTIDGLNAAGAIWSRLLSDNITVNIDVSYEAMGPESGGLTYIYGGDFRTYTEVRDALVSHATSADDVSSSSALQGGPGAGMMINRTADNPNGAGSPTPYFDNDGGDNNRTQNVGYANAKALGLVAADAPTLDARIIFSSDSTYDFDRSDGISADAYDFVGVSLHEIGHALGFFSGMDLLDYYYPPIDGPYFADQYVFVTPLDLFRFSPLSREQGLGVFDWAVDGREKYFSVDGGNTSTGATFSTGYYHGDGGENGHWTTGKGFGIMDPVIPPGQMVSISQNDLRAFDVIGYTLTAPSVPEPSTLWTAGLGLACASLALRNRGHSRMP